MRVAFIHAKKSTKRAALRSSVVPFPVRRVRVRANCQIIPDFAPTAKTTTIPSMNKTATVYLVGAGPGDAGLLTLRGAELLRRADVVIYDQLVNPELLRHAPGTAELIPRGKRQEVSQEQLNALMIAKARAGKCVVRLKGGDPYIFGRGAGGSQRHRIFYFGRLISDFQRARC